MTLTLSADVIELHCFRCRVRSTFDRILQSRPVYKCRGCGNTKEVEELGRTPLPPAPTKIFIPPQLKKHMEKTMAETPAKERKLTRNPLQDLVITTVEKHTDEIRTELNDLRKEVNGLGKGDGDKALRSEFRDMLENEIPELVQRCLIQMLATPTADVRKPPRKVSAGAGKSAYARPPVIEGKAHDHKTKCGKHCSARQP